MKGDAEKLALSRRTGEALLAVDTDFEWRQTKRRSGARRKTVEIGRPDRANKVGLGEVTEKLIANMRPGFADLVLKIGTPVFCDRKALLDIISVLFRCAFRRKASLSIKPLLNLAPDAGEGKFGKLIFKAGVVGEEDAALPLPDTHLRRR